MKNKRRFKSGEIPTSSMADIAFLLLIFFLVTTTIDTDKGLGIVLPPPGDVEIEIKKKNILNCLINSQGAVLLDEEPTPVDQISGAVKRRLAENPLLIVSVKSHKKTEYSDYVRVIDQLKTANAMRISIANSN
ncbi:MAG: biopolymer transporter ExbD [Candidatus Marinimicrobia bacterium]|jgi:biopolymer transport protein ExbD|nr:biopolymer transporter ExbD [Candidatus Neomarinimicrobiota bacterium]MBT3937302.1 biopolymer transporter ExbD [Candidatus Neomarinimicrobiota bacterium]MBT3961276.1 biopolymer transporter ExbD [Candidatus Neomarinimicrobiota bacterium]MBT4383498.1 biopolymer transporter ExbD [Candidatus Neomarinimicrobiota bacterium]MBT4636426.1 biopolymer transporter ExbD [Candidatus Neomarinimicrobiota bacterium]|tara:strand:- start:185 stop:583 length:399 start_codon:yes stop_codon:yes gene_type:complete